MTQSLRIRYSVDEVEVDTRCRFTFCFFTDCSRTVIVWVNLFDSIQVNNVEYPGVQCQISGWVELSERRSPTTEGTLARSHTRVVLQPEHDTDDESSTLLRPLFDIVRPMHETLSRMCYSMFEIALLEEDWGLHKAAE